MVMNFFFERYQKRKGEQKGEWENETESKWRRQKKDARLCISQHYTLEVKSKSKVRNSIKIPGGQRLGCWDNQEARRVFQELANLPRWKGKLKEAP